MNPDPSPYPLSRSHLSTTRLIAQHALWQHDLRYLLHPTITTSLSSTDSFPRSSPTDSQSLSTHPRPRIADLATGTAFWSLSLLQQYPDAQITASDISLRQAPPPAWLPSGLTLHEWDIYAPVPEAWIGQFDIVHLRLALLVIKGNDTSTVLRHAYEMLSPGGWLQWDELDVEGAYTVVAEGAGVGEEDVRRFQRMQELTDFGKLGWVRGLEGAFVDAGFGRVGTEVVEGEKSGVGFLQRMQFLVMREEARAMGGEERERVEANIRWGEGICERGVARVVPKVVVWGRKMGEEVGGVGR